MSILNKIFDALFEGLQQRIAPYGSPWKNNVETPPQFIADVRQAMADMQQYQSRGDQGALDRAVAAWERIITSSTFSYSLQTFQLSTLNEAGVVLWKRYHEKGQRTDLDKALKNFNQVVAATPTNSPDRTMYLKLKSV